LEGLRLATPTIEKRFLHVWGINGRCSREGNVDMRGMEQRQIDVSRLCFSASTRRAELSIIRETDEKTTYRPPASTISYCTERLRFRKSCSYAVVSNTVSPYRRICVLLLLPHLTATPFVGVLRRMLRWFVVLGIAWRSTWVPKALVRIHSLP